MKSATVMAALAGIAATGAIGWYLWRRSQPASRTESAAVDPSGIMRAGGGGGLVGGGGTYSFAPADRYDLSGTGQGSGFFTRQFQLSGMS